MNSKLKKLSEIVAKANDSFTRKFDHLDTLMGIMDKTLRAQGMKADAVTIDCIALDKKIVFLIHDNKPDIVGVAQGNKDGDIYSSLEYKVSDLSESTIVGIIETYFI